MFSMIGDFFDCITIETSCVLETDSVFARKVNHCEEKTVNSFESLDEFKKSTVILIKTSGYVD